MMEAVMELKEFVAEALVQIQEGVQEAIERRSQNSEAQGFISPHRLDLKSLDPNDWDKYVQKVDFDLAVNVSDKKGAEGKGTIKIFSIADVGGSKSKSSETSTVCRVKFTIPIIPPAQRL
jgi:hypothetical protein